MKEESAGHFLDGFGIFGPSRIQPRSFKAKILLLQDFDFRFAQTTSSAAGLSSENMVLEYPVGGHAPSDDNMNCY